jgi:predicted nuclease of predicted toxin-antitoxin system
LARLLRESGIHAEDVRDTGLRGRPDDEVIRHAAAHDLALLTADLGFGNILRFPLESHAGVVVARLPNEMPTGSLNHRILGVLRGLSDEEVSGNLVIIEATRIRLRRRH